MPRPADPYPVNAEPQKRVAVIGSGIAGLTAAHLLSRRYHVTLIEREEVLGMDAHSKTSHNARMDIPLRVFSESYYPNLCRLYRSIGVAFGTADYSFSLVDDCRGGGAYFRYVNLLVRGLALPLPSPTLLLAPQRAVKTASPGLEHACSRSGARTPSISSKEWIERRIFLVGSSQSVP